MHAPPLTLGQMLATGEGARVGCSRCKSGRRVDLAKLIEAVGPDFSLFNKRAKCRLMKNCPGWNRFFTTNGFGRMLWDEQTDQRWMDEDWAERMEGLAASISDLTP